MIGNNFILTKFEENLSSGFFREMYCCMNVVLGNIH